MPHRTLLLSVLAAALPLFFVIPMWTAPVSLKKPVKEITNSIGMKLVRIEPGKFMMGSPTDEEDRGDDEHLHEVEITKPFYMGVYPVTQKEYKAVMGSNPSCFSADGNGKDEVKGMDTSKFPVESVNWYEAVEFCEKLSGMEKEKAAGRVYRLPTECEWEGACRAGTKTAFHYGDSLSSTQANFAGNYPYGGAAKGPYLERTCKVGSYKPNAWGLYDMHGNVLQWCSDWYGKDYYRNRDKTDPKGSDTGDSRVFRGGSWNVIARYCRAADRSNDAPRCRNFNIGFRIVCIPSGK